jgi:alginate O-acetyltransferase complex protein AlgI
MVFSSTIFLFAFLPIVLLCYYLAPFRLKNIFLLLASLIFYAWGEFAYTLLMIVSITWNYILGRVIEGAGRRKKAALFLGVAVNLGILGYFKYASFLIDNINLVLTPVGVVPFAADPIHLPLGISFFTFQAISYLVDVYRQECRSQKNILTLGLYISMFPQLIAGPIVRYGSIAQQLVSRRIDLVQIEEGVRRFTYGLAKKLLIANPLGEVADALFALPPDQLTALPAWIAIIAFSLQIYFDFSGYSDMAIGLGLMLGFRFPENFNYPYYARNVREFWRRWHMSLTNWLRDYLYIPLGGSRVARRRLAFNLITVFLLCGLWHGASWNFVIWGAWHGAFIASERGALGGYLLRFPAFLQHVYLLLVVVVGWVFFRVETLPQALSFFGSLIGLQGWSSSLHPIQLYLSREFMLACLAGVFLSMPVFDWFKRFLEQGRIGFVLRFSLLSVLLYGSFMKISSGTYNPFLYFRF